MRHRLFRWLALLALVAVSSLTVYAQSSTSSLSGSITDPSGAVIPGAVVTIKSAGTGAEFTVVSAANGTFTVPALGAGTYTVTVTATGFKQAVVPNVAV